MKDNTLYNLCRTLLLVLALSAGGVGDAWGQSYRNITITNRTPEPSDLGGYQEVIYANEGESKTFRLQESGAENLDGYIRWYVITDLTDLTNTANQKATGITPNRNGNTYRFANGYAWFRQQDETSPEDINGVSYQVSFGGKEAVYLVCEASANNNYTIENRQRWEAPTVSYRQVYEIRQATQRVQGNTEDWSSKLPVSDATLKDKFLDSYDIHMPINRIDANGKASANQTTFRLPERLDNYYVPAYEGNLTAAQYVRWRIYNSDGSIITGLGETTDNNMLKNKVLYNGNTYDTKRTYYITAEVSYTNWGNVTWYPVSLLTVILEPNSAALTQAQLADNVYDFRTEEYLLNHQYALLEDISFEKESNVLSGNVVSTLQGDPSQNYSTTPMQNVDSYYAFANPGDYSKRRANRMNVGRGEYALYRTLNYPNISKGNIQRVGKYNDYFANIYNKRVVDRLWEKSNGQQSGYFMFLDATDDPGVITKMDISGLCPHTSLVVSAWICDLAHSSNASQADVSFTFKRIDSKKGEVILSRFFSGEIDNKPDFNTSGEYAQWQQVFFQFSFPDGAFDDKYILEIANNAPSSNGADYAIDDIKVYKSTPAITAQREDACSASVLVVSSDYQTLQKNMSWDIDPDVIDNADLSNPTYRKYRYGMMGDDPYAPVEDVLQPRVGNVYFSFTEINGDKVGDWVVLNKELEAYPELNKLGLQYAMRIAVQTDMNTATDNMIPTTREDALKREVIMNVRAMNDFIEDVRRGKRTEAADQATRTELEGVIDQFCQRVASNGSEAAGVTDAKMIKEVYADKIIGDATLLAAYDKAMRDLFVRLEIPRIRCPWRSEDNTMLYLSEIDVHNTDLRFANEIYQDEQGNTHTATGEYYVILFSAKQIAEAAANGEEANLDLDSQCALKKKIFVVPSITIKVDTETEANGVTCEGAIHTLHANLTVADVDEYGNVISTEMKDFDEVYKKQGYSYTFDWFLGSLEESEKLVENTSYNSLQALLKTFREGSTDAVKQGGAFTVDDVSGSNLDDTAKQILISLLGDGTTEPRLVSGKAPSFRWVPTVVAMPYVAGPEELTGQSKLFCLNSQELTLNAESNVPELNVGFPKLDYPVDVELGDRPLRLGQGNLHDETTTLTIPLQNQITFGVIVEGSNHVLKELPNRKEVLLRQSGSIYTPVATLNSLLAREENTNENKLSLTFDKLNETTVKQYFKEGETYSLYIPFGEYESEEAAAPIEGSCEGYAYLQVKIVPEFLTWQGDAGNVWYNDANWHQSSEGEIYKDPNGTSTADANGTDPDLTKAFAPLYFTKVTVPSNKELSLMDESALKNQDKHGYLDLSQVQNTTEHIQYEMAVDRTDAGIQVVPYYGNHIDQIYLKPAATLMNQHYLIYDKAWVEFTLQANRPYWLASPLQAVYAGDMYTLKNGRKQNTEAFLDITYNNKEYSRWDPAFYQKAWNKTVSYAATADANGNAVDIVEAAYAKSNWSIEYNDVWVPYSLGKGFYLRVDEKAGDDVTVRLPKADLNYTYEQAPTTRAALSEQPTERLNAGKLAGGDDLTVSVENIDGDGDHFLVGNPYMSYLDMQKFFDGNKALGKKYWTIAGGTSQAVVGTPDVQWTGNETEDGTQGTIAGYVAPMTAFFVERADYEEPTTKAEVATPIQITFTPAMMSAKPSATADKVSALRAGTVQATAPRLILTASRGDVESRSVITRRDDASDGYRAAEDAVVLLDSELDAAVAYSVAGSMAAQLNAVRSINNIPLGICNNEGHTATLILSGISRWAEPLSLYDARTQIATPLTGDTLRLEIMGNSHGRYFLRSNGNPTSAEAISGTDISIYSPSRGKVVAAAGEALQNVRVVSLSGEMLRSYAPRDVVFQFDLPQGIYIIQAATRTAAKSYKVRVR